MILTLIMRGEFPIYQKSQQGTNINVEDLWILLSSQILATPCHFSKKMRTTVEVELINFQYSKHKIDIQTYYKKRH